MPETFHAFTGIREVADQFDGFVLDVWGVIHDGVRLYPGVVDTLERLAAAGKRMVMLTNAPRRADAIARAMAGMGVPARFLGAIMSSGEATHEALARRPDGWYASLGRRCLHIGPARDRNLFDGLDLARVETAEAADFILNTGPWRDEETVADYEPILAAGAARGLKMICANPDLEVIRGGVRIICAGALALRYDALGGPVRWLGKPHADIYAFCFDRLGIADHARIVAIGDSLRTDIAGAAAAGLASIVVTGGIHAEEFAAFRGGPADPAKVAGACRREGLEPIGHVARFVW
ncbi:MAG: TIGR01459 family HAD-type hydrolase [Alphaproteobacteria bacterium]|nr:TIGR01459 family HAD-type hydrolase [Alphaproteobacteria bacterium]